MKKISKYYYENTLKYIPKGSYCYNNYGPCVFWDMDIDKPKQERGYCHYLKLGDWEDNGTNLLYDMCKECGINE